MRCLTGACGWIPGRRVNKFPRDRGQPDLVSRESTMAYSGEPRQDLNPIGYKRLATGGSDHEQASRLSAHSYDSRNAAITALCAPT